MNEKSLPYDASELLTSEEAVDEYLQDALKSGDPKVIARALGDVARAKGMAELAAKSGLSRESLYRALSEDGNPRLDTLMKVLAGLGLKLDISSSHAAE